MFAALLEREQILDREKGLKNELVREKDLTWRETVNRGMELRNI